MNEAAFQRRVVDAAKLYGWRCCHTRKAMVRAGQVATPTSVPGWPDLVLWHETHAVVLFVELKADKGYLSAQQRDVLASLSNAGASIAIWRPRDWPHVLAVLQDPRHQVGVLPPIGDTTGGAA